MNRARLRNLLLMAWALVVVTACGGGGGGGVASSGGTGGTGVSYGPVTGFGSVFVNGVEFDTTNSTVTLNGSPGPDTATDPHRGLMVGMVVKVDGTFDSNSTTGTAASITYKNNLVGPVSSIISIGTGILNAVVLGQNVIIDSQTTLSGITFDALSLSNVIGNVFEVSGLVDNNGNIHATFVEWKAASFDPSSMELEVKGTIQNLDSVLETFKINDLTVNYSLASLPTGGLANGRFVEVKGVSFIGVALAATNVALDDNTLGVTDASVAQTQGFVTAMTSPSQFTVGGQPVQTTAFTVFEGGSASNIALGKKMKVDGILVGGILTAMKISFL